MIGAEDEIEDLLGKLQVRGTFKLAVDDMILRFKVRLNRQRQNFVQVLHQLGHLRIFLRADRLSVELEAQVLFAWFWHAVGDDLRLDAGY